MTSLASSLKNKSIGHLSRFEKQNMTYRFTSGKNSGNDKGGVFLEICVVLYQTNDAGFRLNFFPGAGSEMSILFSTKSLQKNYKH